MKDTMNPKPRYLSVLSDKGLAVESHIIAFSNSVKQNNYITCEWPSTL